LLSMLSFAHSGSSLPPQSEAHLGSAIAVWDLDHVSSAILLHSTPCSNTPLVVSGCVCPDSQVLLPNDARSEIALLLQHLTYPMTSLLVFRFSWSVFRLPVPNFVNLEMAFTSHEAAQMNETGSVCGITNPDLPLLVMSILAGSSLLLHSFP